MGGGAVNHALTARQQLSVNAETSRRYHLMLARLDDDLRDLEAIMMTMPIKQFNERRNAIIALRETLRQQWEQS
jgi:hypothetical protein